MPASGQIHTLSSLEQAINHWLQLESTEEMVLGDRARKLANLYGLLIYEKREFFSTEELSPEQKEAFFEGMR